ncbi:MAG: aldose 1-epimerase [Gaiellales bacterium]|jgi:galactose mutarotase-like enzyme|nr:aldose 1-epimerase [Gaiellales bacterium]
MHSVSLNMRDAHPTRVLVAGDGPTRAEFAPGLGMVCCSLTHRGEELLGQRGGLRAYAERGSTMGIPLLHPWANRLAGPRYVAAGREVEFDLGSPMLHLDDTGLPIHGVLARFLPFQVTMHSASVTEAHLTAGLDSDRHPQLSEVFPFRHRLEVHARLSGASLAIRTTLTALDEPVPVSFGYHPYLQLPGVPRERLRIAVPLTTRLRLDERMIPTGDREPGRIEGGELGGRSFDDAFADVSDGTRFTVAGGGRTIAVTFTEGYGFAQLFAPPDQDLICFEPMTAPANALVDGRGLRLLAPGESHTAGFSITIE